MTTLQKTLITGMVIASVLTPLVVQHRTQARLRSQDEALRQRTDQLAKLQEENQRLVNLLTQPKGSRLPSDEQFQELLRLRGEVGRLRTHVQELLQPKTTTPVSRSNMLASMANFYAERVSKLKLLLETNPSEQVPELQFLTNDNWLWLANKWPLDTEDDHRRAMSTARQMAEENFVSDVLKPALQQYAKDHNGQFPTDISQLKPSFKSPVDEAILQRWAVWQRSRLVNGLQTQLDEDWYITQKVPVNAALDQRILCGLKNVHSFADGPPEFWDSVQ